MQTPKGNGYLVKERTFVELMGKSTTAVMTDIY